MCAWFSMRSRKALEWARTSHISVRCAFGDALQEGLGEGPEFALATSRLKIGGTRMRRAAFWGGSGITSEK